MLKNLRAWWYKLTHYREIKTTKLRLQKMDNIIKNNLDRALKGEEPVKIYVNHDNKWAPIDYNSDSTGFKGDK